MRKLAVPTRNGMVDEHFGHCESFTVITLDENNKISEVESFSPPAECGCRSGMAGKLKGMGVSLLIAGNMGEGAVLKLAEQGIEVVRGAKGPVNGVVEAWLTGRLKDNRELCRSHDHECSH